MWELARQGSINRLLAAGVDPDKITEEMIITDILCTQPNALHLISLKDQPWETEIITEEMVEHLTPSNFFELWDSFVLLHNELSLKDPDNKVLAAVRKKHRKESRKHYKLLKAMDNVHTARKNRKVINDLFNLDEADK